MQYAFSLTQKKVVCCKYVCILSWIQYNYSTYTYIANMYIPAFVGTYSYIVSYINKPLVKSDICLEFTEQILALVLLYIN